MVRHTQILSRVHPMTSLSPVTVAVDVSYLKLPLDINKCGYDENRDYTTLNV